MKVKIKMFDPLNNATYDLSKVASDITVTTYLYDNPGKLEFTVYAQSPVQIHLGNTVSLILDGYKMFKGFLFSYKVKDNDFRLLVFTCYDQMRYLQNKDFMVFENKTSSQIFKQVCKQYVLRHKVIDESKYICPARVEDATSLYDMIQHAIDATLAFNHEWFFIRDNYGTLEHRSIFSSIRNEVIGDASYMTGWEYEESIDKETYTQVKLYRDNQDTGKRDTYITAGVADVYKRRIIQYGILQLYEKVDENLTEAQIAERGKMLLKAHLLPTKTLSIKALGLKDFYAGCLFKIKMKKVRYGMWLDNYFVAEECVHKISENEHTMEIKTAGMMAVRT